ncbi:MAG: hypothetical protein J3Q66DRAFT_390972 [Benniella sp.]|nr:MAG: hypothetical protein J3Q66DRAFT_390972 [Benniella sp.]
MLDLPELLEKIFQDLKHHDLAQCAQVNKHWHALTVPFLWRDVTCVCIGGSRRKAFRRIVLEDYLQENGRERGLSQPSALLKYGQLIRLLPSPRDLESVLRSHDYTQQGDKPTAHALLQHLFKRSSEAQVESLRYPFQGHESDEMESILAFTLPRLRSLFIQGTLQGTQSGFFKFKSVLDQCSTTLRYLDVDMKLQWEYGTDMEVEASENESDCWTSLKELSLRYNTDYEDAGQFWSWMWKRCGQVKHLQVFMIDKTTPSLVQAMSLYMPNLQELTVGIHSQASQYGDPERVMEDDVVAALLSGSSHGWKAVSIRATARLERETINALATHYSTLKELHIDGHSNLPNRDLIQILRYCPHLRSLSYINLFNDGSVVDGATFIDLDPDTGLLKPWLCEGSLKSLAVKIANIPRPDLPSGGFQKQEEYPGQGREMQNQVYDRLGSLTSLETLRLSNRFGTFRDDCLEMSLESGLDKLSGLKSLQELHVTKMATKIGIKEARWMVENWPKLSVIYGLGVNRWDVDARLHLSDGDYKQNVSIPPPSKTDDFIVAFTSMLFDQLWHALTIPHIWRDLTYVCMGSETSEIFRRIVLEDYLQEKRYKKRPPQPSTLSKYGHLIRLLPSPEKLESALRSEAFAQRGIKPTAHDLLFQLFKRSSKAQVKSLRYKFKDLESNKMKAILAFTLPRLRSLDIQASFQGTQSEFIKFKNVLDQCSTILENLNVDLTMLHADEAFNMDDKATENESICWTSLKVLTLRHHPDIWDAGPVWSWMWKRCGQVEKLCVRNIDQSTPGLVQAMSVNMPKLKEIIIGVTYTDRARNLYGVMEDDVVAALLSGSRHGWKAIEMQSTVKPGQKSMDALAMHYSGLEEAHIHVHCCLPSHVVVQVLRSCPHLHTLIYSNSSSGRSVVGVKAFIDLDPNTGLLKPWLCEGSLKILEVKIAGIPRPDLERKRVVREAYPGQGREIQSQVYDRIGRLTNLERLGLGDGYGTAMGIVGINEGVTEIKTQICPCAQVNKQWHTLAIPHIWRDLTYVNSYDAKSKAFSRIVLEDYLQENGHEDGPPQPTALSKYGHLIRFLPSPETLESILRSQACIRPGTETTVHGLLFHLLKFTSKAQVEHLSYRFKDPESDKMKAILAFTLPRLRSLFIQASLQGTRSEFFKLKSVLDQCSTTLGHLNVEIDIKRADEAVDMEDNATEDESISWTSLKELTLRHSPDPWNAGRCWSWLWKRCGQLERLNVRKIDVSTPSLVKAMSAYMHNLQRISIGDYNLFHWVIDPEDEMEDDVVAALLYGCHGLKSVSMLSTATLGQETMNALAMHYSTLEELNVDGSYELPSRDLLVQVLRSCPHLRSLTYTDYSSGNAMVFGESFIDVDPDTGLLNPWLCEGSLSVLSLKLIVPQPDLGNGKVLEESYPGQGREIQSQVYGRLGRLTNLEALKLGDLVHIYEHECLEMSLESGLEKLSGLKSLKELNVVGLATKIGDKEIQWMTENWPKLSFIYGVYKNGKDWRR